MGLFLLGVLTTLVLLAVLRWFVAWYGGRADRVVQRIAVEEQLALWQVRAAGRRARFELRAAAREARRRL